MSVRSNLDTEQFSPVGVPSAAEQEARRKELANLVPNMRGAGDPYKNHMRYLQATAKERCSSKISFEQALGDVPLNVRIVNIDEPTRLNRIHLVSTLAKK